MENTVKAIFDIANAHGFSLIEINPVFKLIVTKGVSGIQVYDFNGNDVPFDDYGDYVNLVLEYPSIKAVKVVIDEENGLYEKTVELIYEEGKLKEGQLKKEDSSDWQPW